MPKTSGANDFALALDYAFAQAPIVRRVMAGIFELDLCFTSGEAEVDFSSAFPDLQRPLRTADAKIAILTGPSSELETLIPSPRTGHGHFSDERFYALWQPEPADVL